MNIELASDTKFSKARLYDFTSFCRHLGATAVMGNSASFWIAAIYANNIERQKCGKSNIPDCQDMAWETNGCPINSSLFNGIIADARTDRNRKFFSIQVRLSTYLCGKQSGGTNLKVWSLHHIAKGQHRERLL